MLGKKPAMLPLLVLVPVAPIIVSHLTAVSALVRSQSEVHIHLVVFQLLILIEPFPTVFTSILLVHVFHVNCLVVLFNVFHHNSTYIACSFLYMDFLHVFFQLQVTPEHLVTKFTLRWSFTVDSFLVIKNSTICSKL